MAFARARCQLVGGGVARSLAVRMVAAAPRSPAEVHRTARCVHYAFPVAVVRSVVTRRA